MASKFLSNLFEPDSTLNYGFLACVYFVLALISVVLFCLQHFEITDTVTGFWLVPAPTIPALIYVLFLRSRASKHAAHAAAAKKST